MMKNFLLIPLSLLISCSSRPIPQKVYVDADGEIHELENPFQEHLLGAISSTEKISPHTVYDNSAEIEAYKQNRTQKILENFSLKYKTYRVETDEELSSIAMKIFGDESKSKMLQAWNTEVLAGDSQAKKGMQLRYLPSQERAVASETAVEAEFGSETEPEPEYKTYKVKANENLGSISFKLLKTSKAWKKLQEWNPDKLANPNNIMKGMILRYIPIKKKQR